MGDSTSSMVTTGLDPTGQLATYTLMTIFPANTTLAPTTRSVFSDGLTVDTGDFWRNGTPTPFASTITRKATSTTTTTSFTTEQQPTATAGLSSSIPALTTDAAGESPTDASSTQSPGFDSSPPQASSSGVSTGALAGAVVGSVIGTALIAFLLAFLFFRRRQRQTTQSPKGIPADSDSGFVGIVPLREKPGAPFSLAAIVPESADDEAVRSRILTLIDQASLHVDNYYAPGVPPSLLSEDAIAKLAKYNSEYLPASLLTMLGQRRVQRQVITHVLVRTLLSAIQPGGQLLPALFAKPQVNSSTTAESAVFAWRMLTAYLYQHGTYITDPTHAAARSRAAESLAADFTSAFAPYGLSTFSEEDRLAHLTHVARAMAELGIWLFAQPCTFRFDWDKRTDAFTMSPRVIKVYDEQGKSLGSGQVLEKETQVQYPTIV